MVTTRLAAVLCLIAASAAIAGADVHPTLRRTKLRLHDARDAFGRPMVTGDAIDSSHEQTHGLNSRLREAHGGAGINALYVLNGHYAVFREPPFSIADVTRYVTYRGRAAAEYLSGRSARSWNDRPLYLFDEWVAYSNKTLLAVEYRDHRHGITLPHSLEFAHYCSVVVEMLPAAYEDRLELTKFWVWYAARLAAVARRAVGTPLWKPRCQEWLDLMEATIDRVRSWLPAPRLRYEIVGGAA